MIIIGETVAFRSVTSKPHFQPLLFWSYAEWKNQRRQIVANVVLFIPFGMITGRLWKWKGVLSGAGLSAIIELLQLISQRGLFEFDDIINNTLGPKQVLYAKNGGK